MRTPFTTPLNRQIEFGAQYPHATLAKSACHWLLSLITVVLLFLFLHSKGEAQLDHSWQPSKTYPPGSNQTAPYGLVDLDHFPVGDYGYCKWGNLMDVGMQVLGLPLFIHNFDNLTGGPFDSNNKDLFFSRSLSSLQLVALPAIAPATTNATWHTPICATTNDPAFDGYVSWIPNLGDQQAALFRKLHFSTTLYDLATNAGLSSNTSKVIVVIHGWNRDGSDPFGGADFQNLKSSLLNKTRNSDWKVVFYNWAADADTGGLSLGSAGHLLAEHPTKAAEIAHQHGQHLGELLAATSPNGALQKVHFIAHSAGAWTARAAARYITTNTYAKVEVTLLDPFMPARLSVGTFLTEQQISNMTQFDATNSGQLYRLENYYAIDDAFDTDSANYATSQEFSWRTNDINLRIDWLASPTDTYKRHSGPVSFYADTIWDPTLSSISLQNPRFIGIEGNVGWRQSMFFQEPQITLQPTLPNIITPGQTPTLYSNAQKRGLPNSPGLGISFQWQTLSGSDWSDIPGANSNNYTLPSVTTAMTGAQYRLKVSDQAGIDVSNPVMLNVGPAGGTVPGTPTGLTATAVSASQINLSWTAAPSDNNGFLLQRRVEPTDTYQTILDVNLTVYHDTGLSASTQYSYQVIAKGSPNSNASAPATGTTLPPSSAVKLLTVNSSNPATGVRIYVGPNDINGAADGYTSFTRQYSSGTDVTLVASATWNGSNFQKWQRDGQDWAFSAVTDVLMDNSHTMTAVYAPSTQTGNTFTIAVSASPSSGGTVTGNASYSANATANIQAFASSGYTFLNWTRNTSGQNGGQTFAFQPQVSFTATSNLSLVANFTQDANNNYTITTTAEPPAGGVATGGGSYAPSSNVNLGAAPSPGYVFDYWMENGAIISYIQNYQFAQVSKAHDFVAHFHAPQPGDAPDIVPKLDSITRYAFPDGHLNVSASVKNRGTLTSNPFSVSYRITNIWSTVPPAGDYQTVPTGIGIPPGVEGGISSSLYLWASMQPGDYYLWLIADPAGVDGEPAANRSDNSVMLPFTVLPSPTFSGPDLLPQDFTVSPLTTVGGTIIIQGAVRNVGNANSTLANTYVSISQSATVPPDKNALNTSSPLPVLGIYDNAIVSHSVTLPNALSAGNYYIWIMVDPDATDGEPTGNRANNNLVLPLTLAEPLQTYNIAANSTSPTQGEVTGAGSYSTGALVPLVANPLPGYVFVNWTEAGLPVSSSSVFTFTATTNRTLTANFSTYTWTVTSSAGANGTLTPNGSQGVGSGNNISYTASPIVGYMVDQWVVNGSVAQTGGNSFVFSGVSSDSSVQVTFRQLAYTLSVVGANGTIQKLPSLNYYPQNSVVSLTATPVLGYVFSGWSGDASGIQNPLQVTMASNLNISALFSPIGQIFDEDLDFNDNQVPAGWVLDYYYGGPGRNGGIANQQFEARQVDSYPSIQKTKTVPTLANRVQISYTANITANYWGQGAQIHYFSSDGSDYFASMGKAGNGSASISLAVGHNQPPYEFSQLLPLDTGNYRITAIFEDGRITYTALKQGSTTPLFNQVVLVPGLRINQLQTLRLFNLNTSGDTSWIDDVAIRSFQVASPFGQWQSSYLTPYQISNPSVGGWAGVAHGDGVSNGLRYLFHLNPVGELTAQDRNALPIGSLESVGPLRYMTLTYRQNATATGITMETQISGDLSQNSWQTVVPDFVESLGPDSTTGDPRYKIKVDVTGQPQQFIRLRVNGP